MMIFFSEKSRNFFIRAGRPHIRPAGLYRRAASLHGPAGKTESTNMGKCVCDNYKRKTALKRISLGRMTVHDVVLPVAAYTVPV